MKFGNKRFVFVFLVPIAIFAISFIVTLLERVLIYMVVGFLLAWAVFFYSNRYFPEKPARHCNGAFINYASTLDGFYGRTRD